MVYNYLPVIHYISVSRYNLDRFLLNVQITCIFVRSYEEFHTEQLQRVAQYPDMVNSELNRYEESLCKYFNVGKIPAKSSKDFVDQVGTIALCNIILLVKFIPVKISS